MGILTGEDDINVEQISTNQAVHGEAYQEAIGKAVDACLAQRDEFREQEKFTKSECGMFALKFHGCIMVESMKHSAHSCKHFTQAIWITLKARGASFLSSHILPQTASL